MTRIVMMVLLTMLLVTLASQLQAEPDDRINLLAYNSNAAGPINLQFAQEGFFVRFDPQSDDEIRLLQAKVWVCAEGDAGWPSPDRYHQSFTIVIHHADGDELGDQIYSENVLLDGDANLHWVGITRAISFTGPFFVGSIQANDHPQNEALMHDGNVDKPDIFFTNNGGGWGKCVDRLLNFPGDLLVWCTVERTSAVGDDGIRSSPEVFEIGNFAPNPFNATTSMQITVHRMTSLQMQLVNMNGQNVFHQDLSDLPIGINRLSFDLHDLPSGNYIARFNDNEAAIVKNLTLVK